jgi:hypothetical protein
MNQKLNGRTDCTNGNTKCITLNHDFHSPFFLHSYVLYHKLECWARAEFTSMTHDELEEWLVTVSKIIMDVKIGLDNADRLFAKKYPDKEKALRHGFFGHHYYQLWFICTVQLSKLVVRLGRKSF